MGSRFLSVGQKEPVGAADEVSVSAAGGTLSRGNAFTHMLLVRKSGLFLP